ncbi:MAG: hypothetical protein JWP36_418 [Paucimonas sp.]|nr:hypothetical protein [Paucimonas sp.]
MRFAFRFRWIPFVAALLVAAAGIALGEWQRARAIGKENIEAAILSRAAQPPVVLTRDSAHLPVAELEYRQVFAEGEFLRDWPVYLDNRPYKGVSGFYLAMPFRLAADGSVVLVLRGWLPRNPQDRTLLPKLETPAGRIQLQGQVRRDTGHVMQLGQAAPLKPGAIVQNLTPATFAAASGMTLLPFIIEESPAVAGKPQADGLVRDWPRPSSGADKHRGYAFQWYALATTALMFFLVTGFLRAKRSEPARPDETDN